MYLFLVSAQNNSTQASGSPRRELGRAMIRDMAVKRKRKRSKKPLKDRSRKERWRARWILRGESDFVPDLIYDDDFHPKDIVKYFQAQYDLISNPRENRTERGDLKFVTEPVRAPTLAGYAVKIGVSRECLWAWRQKHPKFSESVQRAKAIQEAFLVEQGTLGALNPQVTIMTLKNLQDWTDKVDVGAQGVITLKFDDQDTEA